MTSVSDFPLPESVSASERVDCKSLVDEASRTIRGIDPSLAREMAAAGAATIVDVRDIRELAREGRIPNSFHAPRGMLEFWIDPSSPYHKAAFSEDTVFVFQCAAGLRSLLAARTAQRMGLKALNMEGGFAAWRAAELPVESLERDS